MIQRTEADEARAIAWIEAHSDKWWGTDIHHDLANEFARIREECADRCENGELEVATGWVAGEAWEDILTRAKVQTWKACAAAIRSMGQAPTT